MNIKLDIPKITDLKPRISVIGIGGAGCNAINNMIATGLEGVEFVAANTDAQALAMSSAEHQIQLGAELTQQVIDHRGRHDEHAHVGLEHVHVHKDLGDDRQGG
ncbi:MAG: hypothetical protein AAGD43_23195, partial [Pseudomonadota bacterium]